MDKSINQSKKESKIDNLIKLYSNTIDTILGKMHVISDDNCLYLLEFEDCKKLDKEIEKLIKINKVNIVQGKSKPIESIAKELDLYFANKLKKFETPINIIGTEFQKKVWNELLNIPFGETRSYKEQAITIGNSKSFRAVANANGRNHFVIIIPCHRIINSNGNLGGYSAGIDRKKWLLNHEKN